MIDRWKYIVFLLQLSLLPNMLSEVASLSTVNPLAGWNCDTHDECNGGADCIPAEWKCNGFGNCPDGSDELGCRGGFECPNSGRWIPREWVCNGYANCIDSADETSCSCPEFTCSSGFCIDNDKKCDKVNDCGDWSDEPNTCDCPTIEFTCDSKYQNFGDNCVAAEKVCDGVFDCVDGSDEAASRCNLACTVNEYRCATGVSNFEFSPCIQNDYVCDGYVDCVDQTDETGSCPGCSERCVSRTQTFNGYPLISICIDQQICDGNVDCLDGSDETVARCDCSNGIECALTGRCISSDEQCDGNNQCGDAKDLTDECYCGYKNYQVQNCSNTGRCLAPWQLCDGVDDCGDGSDEIFCPPAVTDCEYFSKPKFPCHYFTNKDDRCIDMGLVCNGYGDCSDGSDETICNEPCAAGSIRCATGASILLGKPACIPETRWCDGSADCYDHSDENNLVCQDVCKKENYVDISRCKSAADNGTYICINSTNYCDGNVDCADREDEKSCCNSTEYTCSRDYQCIDAAKICDEVDDCTARDDENCAPCDSSSFQCDNKLCIPDTAQCDGTNDCVDNSDEINNCTLPTQCTSGEYRCSNGRCIDIELKCNKADDCSDGSDEENCVGDSRTKPNLGWMAGVIVGGVVATIGIVCGVRAYSFHKRRCCYGQQPTTAEWHRADGENGLPGEPRQPATNSVITNDYPSDQGSYYQSVTVNTTSSSHLYESLRY